MVMIAKVNATASVEPPTAASVTAMGAASISFAFQRLSSSGVTIMSSFCVCRITVKSVGMPMTPATR